MNDPAIETRHLRRTFGDTVAVGDLSLKVGQGEVFGFLGPNGAGKSTTIKMLLGLIAPTGGRGTMLGAPLGNRAIRARVGFLPEHFRFHDVLTGRELLRFHGRLHGMRGLQLDVRVDELLARVDLLDAADRPLHGPRRPRDFACRTGRRPRRRNPRHTDRYLPAGGPGAVWP